MLHGRIKLPTYEVGSDCNLRGELNTLNVSFLWCARVSPNTGSNCVHCHDALSAIFIFTLLLGDSYNRSLYAVLATIPFLQTVSPYYLRLAPLYYNSFNQHQKKKAS